MKWQQITFGEILHVKHGWAFKSEYFSDAGEHIVLTPGNFYEEGGFKSRGDKDRFYSGDYPSEYLLSKGNVIVAMTEQGEGLLGSTALIPEDNRYLHNQRLGLVTIKDNVEADLFFVYKLFNTQMVRQQISGSASGAKVKHTAPERIYKCKVHLPPIEIQQKIATILSAYDDLIENNLKRIKLLEEMAQITYEEWFVRLKFPGHETTSIDSKTYLPVGWAKVKLGVCCDITSSKRIFLSDYVEQGIPFYRGKEIILKSKNEDLRDVLYISVDKYLEIEKTFGTPKPGDILITAVGTLGFPYLVNDRDGKFYFKDGNLIWLRDFKTFTNASYFICVFKNRKFQNLLDSIAIGSSQKALTIQGIKNLDIVMPSKQVIDKFNDVIIPVLKVIENLLAENHLLKEARDILLPRLMTGMIDVEQLNHFVGADLSAHVNPIERCG